jgi:hypothetical protein
MKTRRLLAHDVLPAGVRVCLELEDGDFLAEVVECDEAASPNNANVHKFRLTHEWTWDGFEDVYADLHIEHPNWKKLEGEPILRECNYSFVVLLPPTAGQSAKPLKR